MNAVNVNQEEPVSVDQAYAERKRVVDEIIETQNWLTSRDIRSGGGRISSVNYHRERADRMSRLTKLQRRAGQLRDWIRDYNRKHETSVRAGGSKLHPSEVLLVQLFHAVCDLQERGVEVGSRVETILNEIEMSIPPNVLAQTGDQS